MFVLVNSVAAPCVDLELKMALESLRSRFFQLRAFLVFAALLSLCVSNNVGPCFLPLPLVSDRIAGIAQTDQGGKASPVPYPPEADSFRVPMMAHNQKRAVKEPPPQSGGTTPGTDLLFFNPAKVANKLSFPFFLFTSAPFSQSPGRAPPGLV